MTWRSTSPRYQLGKCPFDALGGEAVLQQIEVGCIIDPDIDVRGVAFVAGARVGDVADDTFFVAAGCGHATSTSSVGLTRARSIRMDFVMTAGVMAPRKPPPPAGPQHSRDFDLP